MAAGATGLGLFIWLVPKPFADEPGAREVLVISVIGVAAVYFASGVVGRLLNQAEEARSALPLPPTAQGQAVPGQGHPLQQAQEAGKQALRLSGVDLRDTELSGLDLGAADLSEASLRDASLGFASLQKANLSGADLRGTDLRGVDLKGSTLAGASLEGSRLEKAELSEANLKEASLDGAVYDKSTVWPVGFSPEDAGAVRAEGD